MPTPKGRVASSTRAQASLAKSPNVTLYTGGFSHFVTSMTAPVASGWSYDREGFAPTGKSATFTRRTPIADIGDQTEKRESVSYVAFNRIDLRRPLRAPIA